MVALLYVDSVLLDWMNYASVVLVVAVFMAVLAKFVRASRAPRRA